MGRSRESGLTAVWMLLLLLATDTVKFPAEGAAKPPRRRQGPGLRLPATQKRLAGHAKLPGHTTGSVYKDFRRTADNRLVPARPLTRRTAAGLSAVSGRHTSGPYMCPRGCVSVVGNGFVSRAQTATSLACSTIYRANFMQNAATFNSTASVCFFRKMRHGFHGCKHRTVERGGKRLRELYIHPRVSTRCAYTVFMARGANPVPLDPDIVYVGSPRHTGIMTSEFVSEVWRTVLPTFTPRPPPDDWQSLLAILRGGKSSSSGAVMLAWALKYHPDRCIHLYGFNFRMDEAGNQESSHPWAAEKLFVTHLLRSQKHKVFFHPVSKQAVHAKGAPAYGLD